MILSIFSWFKRNSIGGQLTKTAPDSESQNRLTNYICTCCTYYILYWNHCPSNTEFYFYADFSVSKEQILNLQIHLPKDWSSSFKNYRTYLIVAVDTSGSMGGSPIKQVCWE